MKWFYIFLPTALACKPPLRSYNFHNVPDGTGFDLKWQKESAKDYFMSHYNALKAAAQIKVDAETDLSTAMALVGTEKDIDAAVIQQSQGLLASCATEAMCTLVYSGSVECGTPTICEEQATMQYVCALPTISCVDDIITASYLDHKHYYVISEGNTWFIKYKENADAQHDASDHVLATGTDGQSIITPVTQLCVKDKLCTEPVTIELAEDILPESESNLYVGDTFTLDIKPESSKVYFHSFYATLKALATPYGLPGGFDRLELTPAQVESSKEIYEKCANDVSCEKELIHIATCLGPTVDCEDGEKWLYTDGGEYTVDTTETKWILKYSSGAVLAEAEIGVGATTITPINQVNPLVPIVVELATPFEPKYLGAYDLNTGADDVTCEFGSLSAECKDDVLVLSGCFASFAEECGSIQESSEYINKQCCASQC